MRYGLIISLLLLFGLSEYAFVEYYPLQPHQREAKFKRLPLVRNVVQKQTRAIVRDAFKHDDDGVLWLVLEGDSTSWTSPSDLWNAYQDKDRMARRKVLKLENAQESRDAIPYLRQQALDGDTFARIWYYSIASHSWDPEEKDRARELLAQDSTATAAWYLAMWSEPKMDTTSKEYLLLSARMNLENLRPANLTEEQAAIQAQKTKTLVEQLYATSKTGDANAVWVVEQLETEYGIDLSARLGKEAE